MKCDTNKAARILAAAVLPLVGVGLASAAPISWNTASSGNWNVAASWTGGASYPGNTADAVVNFDGTYTVTGNLTGSANTFNSVTIGTAGTTGIATVSGNNNFSFKNMTVGSRGVFIQAGNLILGGAAGDAITVQNGGVFRSTGTNTTANLGGHNVTVDLGGSWELNGANTTPTAGTTLTVNGSATGAGNIYLGVGTVNLAGSGTIGGTGSIVGHVSTIRQTIVSGSLVVDRPWTDNANSLHFNDGAVLTLNGGYSTDRTASVTTNKSLATFAMNGVDGSATVNGTGNVSITNSNADGASVTPVGGMGTGSAGAPGGSLTFGGTGSLAFNLQSAANMRFVSSNLNLQRDTTLSQAGTGFFEQSAGNKINVSGSGVTATMGSGVALRSTTNALSTDAARQISVNGNGELRMSGIAYEANSDGSVANLHIGRGTTGTLTLDAGTTNTLRRFNMGYDPDGAGGYEVPTVAASLMAARLDTNAVVSVGAGAKLALSQATLRVDMTNGGNWGFKSAGEINIAGSNVSIEALSDDLGSTATIAAQPFAINTLSLADTGANATVNLWENTSNDGGGADRALYVQTLDLSGLNAGRTLDLTGLGGEARVYYGTLINPNGVSFVEGGEWSPLVVPEPASLALLGLGALMLRRRR